MTCLTSLTALALLTSALGPVCGQGPGGGPVLVPDVLQAARDSYAHGDYDSAARYCQQLQASQSQLTATERGDLTSLRRQTDIALQARRDGHAKLHQAEEALAQSRPSDAAALLKAVTANQYLAPTDRQALSQLNGRLRGGAGAQAAKADPRALLAAARAALHQGDLAEAEKLARQADKAGSGGIQAWLLHPLSDTPAKVLRDVQAARARAAAKELPAPEPAKKDSSSPLQTVRTFFTWKSVPPKETAPDGDRPGSLPDPRAERDLPGRSREPSGSGAEGRVRGAADSQAAVNVVLGPSAGPAEPDSRGQLADTPNSNAQARLLVQEGYEALARKDLARARELGEKARALRPQLGWQERTPEQLLAAVQIQAGAGAVVQTAAAEPDNRPPLKTDSAPVVEASNGPALKPDSGPALQPSAAPAPAVADGTDQATQKARQLIKEGYEALRAEDASRARQLAEQAKSLHPELKWWEDNPDKLLADIDRQAPVAAGKGGAAAGRDPGEPKNKVDTRVLLKKARDLYNQGKFDEADRACAQAALPGTHWGLFEDNPDKLRSDIQKTRSRVFREESGKLLAEARKLFAQGKLSEAKELAARAMQKHGPYSVWDLGDRADRLLTEIEGAELKLRVAKTNAPAVQDPPRPPNPPQVAQQGQKPVPVPVPPRTSGNPPTPPATVAVAPSVKPAVPAPAPSPGGVLARQRAVGLLAEARALQKEGKLVEARVRALEAKNAAVEALKQNAPFAASDDTPDLALANLGVACSERVRALLQHADELLPQAKANPARLGEAERDLEQARELAAAFGQDVVPIDEKFARLQRTRDALAQNRPVPFSGGPVAQGPVPPGPPALAEPGKGREAGQKRLAEARLYLQSGALKIARQIAESVFLDPAYGVQDEARTLIGSIDAEEANQRKLADLRNARTARDLFAQREFRKARGILEQIDLRNLPADWQAKLREIQSMPEMQSGGYAQADPRKLNPQGAGVGKAVVSDDPRTAVKPPPNPDGDRLEQIRAMEQIQLEKLRREAAEATNQARDNFNAGKTALALDVLRDYCDRLKDLPLDPQRVALLRQPMEKRLRDYQTLKAQKDIEDEQNIARNHNPEKARLESQGKKQDEVAKLLKQCNALCREGKLKEAEILVAQVKELDPDNVAADAAQQIIRTNKRLKNIEEMKDKREANFLEALDDKGDYANMDEPLKFNKSRLDVAQKRHDYSKGIPSVLRNPVERRIEDKLSTPVTFNFRDTPLNRVIEDLYSMTGVNVVPDKAALDDAGIKLETPLSLRVDNISLKSALNMLLKQAHLTYVIKDEALQITTEDHARGNYKRVTYPVADLVVPVENHAPPAVMDLTRTLENFSMSQMLSPRGVMPYSPRFALPSGDLAGSMGGYDTTYGTGFGTARPAWSTNGQPAPPPPGPRRPGPQTMEDMLIRLVTTSIAPESWSDMGGKGTIQYYPLGLGLVVNQTQDVQEQVADLLAALRRLQDLEVAIEMRLVAVSESFYERLGMDWEFNFVTPNSRFQPQLTQNQFAPFPNVNRPTPNNFISGLTPAGTFTPDLNIPVNASSYGMSIPPFGQYPGTLGADGGISLGLAFLSDIQVFMLLDAAQGDRRINTMQAPRVTVFNGQQAFLSVNDFQFFLLGVQINQAGDQIFFTPQSVPVPLGVTLLVVPVISADRRFVRLALTPNMTNLASANVPLIPVQIPVPQLFQDNFVGNQPVIFQMFFQQPTFTQISVQTTVTVPDGGTVLLGGLKTLSEGRNEFGPPILSKIPYVNRLFKNVGYGREAQSIMIMVTPRIIINEEEEQIFLGQIPPLPRP